MVKLSSALDYPKCKMLVQVHDEIVISVPSNELNTWEPLVEDCMGNGRVIMGVSLEVEAHHAGSWSEAKG
jgi:DNA polymerase-1